VTEINFYVSKDEGLQQRLAIAYRLVNQAVQRQLIIHIHTDCEETSLKLDDYLWTKEGSSFIPHSVTSNHENNYQEITISHEFEPITNCDYLINLSNQRPAFFSRFSKVAEILDTNEEILTAGRKRYSFYRDRGYTLGYYQL
jgi:DNA polymerase-3 subunit chi